MYLHIIAVLVASLSGGMTSTDILPVSETAFGIWSAVCSEDGCDAWMAGALAATAAEESRGNGSLVHGDGGLACGRYQLHSEWRQGHPCKELEDDAILDARLARDAIRVLEKHCHSRRGALAAYASGKCDQALNYADRRCKHAGGC